MILWGQEGLAGVTLSLMYLLLDMQMWQQQDFLKSWKIFPSVLQLSQHAMALQAQRTSLRCRNESGYCCGKLFMNYLIPCWLTILKWHHNLTWFTNNFFVGWWGWQSFFILKDLIFIVERKLLWDGVTCKFS